MKLKELIKMNMEWDTFTKLHISETNDGVITKHFASIHSLEGNDYIMNLDVLTFNHNLVWCTNKE